MRIILAPMEGVVDHLMREMLTAIGGYDLCVTEFVRVVDQKLPARVFTRLCPELLQGGKTLAGTPVRVQLLGQEPDWLAENAVRAVELGSPGVDLNFGCPAKTVNKSRGGAVLLRDTEQLYRIVKAVRNAVPAEFPVTAKIRLGYEDTRLAIANACAIAEAGASSLAIHARTKSDGYRPPAYWPWIAKIKQQVAIPLVANGEIWNAEQALLCQEQSQCQDIMLGRGALAMPNLAQHIRLKQPPLPWPEVLALLMRYSEFEMSGEKGKYYANRVKQWFSYLKLQYPQASELFQQLRVLTRSADILALLQQQREITERAEARSV
ncbi:tRNA dihydrouridine(16) synthase DusC [Alishewanella sp. SMS8]|uniref:tRNA dihydrouridine(16) synthase DusC n=1 Tax=Alishewanella sp. SMS8 TaxID=2994676 RepID=UPI0027429C35|nr:tRNA dihydrouridine(16) synthase DusC [Alishewanella sp. SMS8]MDP4945438.1 tRNA dihydrouridine(16) synthase DusC [Alishewanella sp.]MDP5036909.1 tRNA dihydrouridine(16) synthase DusC [Alishewanella sp.]MDP5185851.1 tRNA dihydrouridine(16) synthase DusC [Alishewanella sp.]MDP5458801.1 tRNA dihydrouridine(16) synthase DusC [Alishewanella sp. SMS8]